MVDRVIDTPQHFLPFDVRFALQHRKGIMGKADIEVMAGSGFLNESVYLIAKALAPTPDRQRNFVEDVVDFSILGGTKTPAFKDFLKETALGLPIDTNVSGVKLTQISRQGFTNWQERLLQMANALSAHGTVPVLIADAMYMGLSRFVEAYQSSGRPILILDPDAGGCELVGYSIDLQQEKGSRVKTLPAEFDRPEGALLIDDTKNHGTSLENARKLWGRPIGDRVLVDVA